MNSGRQTYESLTAKGFVPDGNGGLRKIKAGSAVPDALAQPHPVQALAIGAERKEGGAIRVSVVVTSFRVIPVDPDNLFAKHLVDCLRYARIIRDDTPGAIDYQIKQVRVEHKSMERTEIEVVKLSPNVNH